MGSRSLSKFSSALTAAVLSVASVQATANWISVGPEGGAVQDVLIDRSNPDRMLALSSAAGIFESTNGGASFEPAEDTPVEHFDFPTPLGLRSIVQHPAKPNIILAVPFLGFSANGWRSTDGGRSWTRIDSVNLRGSIQFNADATRIYVRSDAGLSISTDDGATWTNVPLTGPAAGLDINLASIDFSLIRTSPSRPNRVFIAAGGRLFRSDDAGQSWDEAAPLAPNQAPTGLVVSSDAAETLYAVNDILGGAIYRSVDDGDSWSVAASGLVDPLGDPADFDYRRGKNLAIQPGTGALFALSEGRLHRAASDGQVWTSADLPTSIDFPTGLRFDPTDSNRLVISAGSGLFLSTDGGSTWQPRRTGYRAHLISGLSTSRSVPGTIYADAETSLFRSDDAGRSWSEIGPRTLLDDGAAQPVDSATNPSVLVAVSGNVVDLPIRSTDGGATWSELAPLPGGLAVRIWSDPRDDQRLVAGNFGPSSHFSFVGMFQSTDGGNSWSKVFTPPADRLNFEPYSLADDPTRPGTVFFGIYSLTGPAFNDGLLLRSVDGGASFDIVFDGITLPVVAVDQAGTVFAGGIANSIRPGIWRSTDGGETWAAASNGIPQSSGIWDVSTHPDTPGIAVASTGVDLYVTIDNGASWQHLSRFGLGAGNHIRSVEILSGSGSQLELLVGTDRSVFYTARAEVLRPVPVPAFGYGATVILAVLMLVMLSMVMPGLRRRLSATSGAA